MKERPILFSSSMVLALRNNRKTQTRRITGALKKLNDKPDMWALIGGEDGFFVFENQECGGVFVSARSPYGVDGDRLWTREGLIRPDGDPWLYTADKQPVMVDAVDETAMVVWAHHKQQDYCPSMFMPRWASRDVLEVVSVRPERLHAITRDDCLAEGIHYDPPFSGQNGYAPSLYSHGTTDGFPTAKDAYHALWDEINGKTLPWVNNPWVWAVTFRRLTQ